MQLTLTDIKKTFAGRKPAAIGTHRYFSVLVPFVEKDGHPLRGAGKEHGVTAW